MARLESISPIKAKEAVRAMACTDTPKSAARRLSGSITNSGLTKLTLEETSTNPGILRISLSKVFAVSVKSGPSSLLRTIETSFVEPPPPPLRNVTLAPGMA